MSKYLVRAGALWVFAGTFLVGAAWANHANQWWTFPILLWRIFSAILTSIYAGVQIAQHLIAKEGA